MRKRGIKSPDKADALALTMGSAAAFVKDSLWDIILRNPKV